MSHDIRRWQAAIEVRAAAPGDAAARTIAGSIPLGVDQDLGLGIRERIQPDAFADFVDVVLLADHQQAQPLARMPDSLRLSVIDSRLHVSADVLDSALGNEQLAQVRAGLRRLSVGFRPLRVRRERGVVVVMAARLVELSLITLAAHAGTDVRGGQAPPAPTLQLWQVL